MSMYVCICQFERDPQERKERKERRRERGGKRERDRELRQSVCEREGTKGQKDIEIMYSAHTHTQQRESECARENTRERDTIFLNLFVCVQCMYICSCICMKLYIPYIYMSKCT